ncbi:MAG: tRNA preQ1(34) S-adenosylmethionine ribosyltransferase-isomerase QueA [Acidobacteriota bacterium]
MRIEDLDYALPDELIAQTPLAERSASRMLVVDRSVGTVENNAFAGIGNFLNAGDTLVLNNTRVFPARLLGKTETGASVEIFLMREIEPAVWESLGKPARRMPAGKKVIFGEDLSAKVLRSGDSRLTIEFQTEKDLAEMLDLHGRTPLPQYIKRDIAEPDADRERYQTVFSKKKGAIAAPTAGLHFTPALLSELRAAGVDICEVTLHVGYGTFEPVRVDDLTEHRVLPEEYEIEGSAADMLNRARAEKRRIVAVGTTTTRTLESAMRKNGNFVAERSHAGLTITPGYKFGAIDALLTNFHLPKSSLLLLVSTFAGHELTMRAYRHAVEARYRFFSYGDCMLIV